MNKATPLYSFFNTHHFESEINKLKIKINLNLDGTGKSNIDTGIAFFDHMLDQIAKHGQMDLEIKVDGDFGKLTETSLRSFQASKNLEVNGLYGEKEQELLAPFIASKFITSDVIIEEAKKHNLPESMLLAIKDVEAKSSGYLDDGRVIILFERHKMYSEVRKLRGIDFANAMVKVHPDIINPATGGYIGYEREYDRLNKAKSIDSDCALKSASWGLFQIMGFNFGLAGYENVGDFVSDMSESERFHIQALCNFIVNNPPLYRAMKSRNFQQIALYYNGSNYKINRYDTDLMNIYNTLLRKG